jgi:hypothetical protein
MKKLAWSFSSIVVTIIGRAKDKLLLPSAFRLLPCLGSDGASPYPRSLALPAEPRPTRGALPYPRSLALLDFHCGRDHNSVAHSVDDLFIGRGDRG